jgi:hypothetical protein
VKEIVAGKRTCLAVAKAINAPGLGRFNNRTDQIIIVNFDWYNFSLFYLSEQKGEFKKSIFATD